MSVGRKAAIAAIAMGTASFAHAEITNLASRAFNGPTGFGTEAEDDSSLRNGALSGDGVFLVFSSRASNLVAGDTNGAEDVFVRNNSTGALARVGVGREPVISNDGAWIAFTSDVPLVPEDRNQLPDVYVTNRDTLVYQLVSINVGGESADSPSFSPSISANGNRIAFTSGATDLGPPDANGVDDIFVRDRGTSTTIRASLTDSGGEPDGDSADPSISGDGAFVAFESAADNMLAAPIETALGDIDIFRRDISGGITEYVSNDEGGAEANGASYDPAISLDGAFVAFESLATNLNGSTDTNGTHDVFRRDMSGDGALLVSRTPAGAAGDNGSFGPSISASGGFVAFRSFATDLTATPSSGQAEVFRREIGGASPTTLRIDPVAALDAPALVVAMSSTGARIAFSGNMSTIPPGETFTGRQDVFVTESIDDPGADVVVKASASPAAVATGANDKSHGPVLSSDGRYVVFSSLATNLAPNDTNDREDVWRYDTTGNLLQRVNFVGSQFVGTTDQPAVTGNGRNVAFRTTQMSTAPFNDLNGTQPDIWVRDMNLTESNAYEVISRATGSTPTGTGGDAGCSEPTISENGQFVAYLCDHTNLVANDTNNGADVFVRDRDLGTTERANVDSSEAQTGGDVGGPMISGNGQFVVFHSDSASLVAGDTNGVHDIFVRDLLNGITERVSVDDAFVESNGTSLNASISATGQFVVFESVATNLTGDDEGPNRDIFVRDRSTGETTRVSINTRGEPSDGNSFRPRISGDGRYVVFESTSGNLGAPAGNHAFVHDRLRRATRRLDNDANAFGDGDSSEPVMSNDGLRYALVSDSTTWSAVLNGYRAGDINIWTGAVPISTSITIDSDNEDPSLFDEAVTVTYTLSSDSGSPSGMITVSADTGESCNSLVGTPECTLIFPAEGVVRLNAYYSGDLLFFPANSPGETHSVESPGGPGFTGETPLITPGGDQGDLAGTSVASSEEFVVVGAPNAEGGEGAVYVFRRVDNAPPPASAKSVAGLVAAKDLAPVATLTGGALGDKWGSAVAISPDGTSIVIGAPEAGVGGGAFMFNRPGASWTSDATPDASLVPAGIGIGDKFGSSVAIGAGNMVAVGAPGAATGGNPGAGSATVFNGATPMATLTPDPASADANANFGQSLAMSGGRLVIGAPNEGAGDNGAVRLYSVTADTVSAPTTITPAGGAGIGDKFGTSVAIDGTTVVGGSPGATGGNGAGFVFQDTGGGFTQRGRLDGGLDGTGAGAGMAVAVAGDYILLGAPLADVGPDADQGRAFVFLQPDGGWANASATGSLTDRSGGVGDGYGTSVALTRRGAIVGVPSRDLGLQENQGQADSFIVDRIFRGTFD